MKSDYSNLEVLNQKIHENLEVLNQQIHESRRITARALSLIVFFSALITCLLIIQNWQLILGLFLWLSSLIYITINTIFSACSQSKSCTSLMDFIGSTYVVIASTCGIAYFVYLMSTLFTRGTSEKVTLGDKAQLRRETELDAEMQKYWRRKREYLR